MLSQKELDEFRKEVRAWFKENAPTDPGFLLPQTFMEVSTDDQFHFLRDWQCKVYDAGYLGMAWPKKFGGGGQPQALQDIVTQEMVRQKTPFMVNTIGLNWAGPLILNMGSEEQGRAYIPGILSAEDIWCQGFSEPDHGSDLANVRLKAEREGGEFVLNGSKIWTSLGQYAKYMILLARSNPHVNNKYEGMSFLLIPMRIPGIEVVPIRKLTGEYGFNQTFFANARVSVSCLIGEEGGGWQVAMATLAFERGAAGGQAGGHSMMSKETADVVALARVAARNGRPAIEDPMIRDRLVQFIMEERAAELNAARARIKALNAERPHSIPMSVKLVRSEFQRKLCQFALSLQGASAAYYLGDSHAYERGLWQRAYFNAFSATIGGGTSEIQRNIIGERVLGLPKS